MNRCDNCGRSAELFHNDATGLSLCGNCDALTEHPTGVAAILAKATADNERHSKKAEPESEDDRAFREAEISDRERLRHGALETELNYTIIDPNITPRHRELAFTPFIDIAEAMALAYVQWRYGGRAERGFIRPGVFRPIEVRTAEGETVCRVGFIERVTVGKLEA